MEKTAKQMLTELIDNFSLTKEILAGKFGCSHRTIERWSTGEVNPKMIALKYITQVYNGYVNAKQT